MLFRSLPLWNDEIDETNTLTTNVLGTIHSLWRITGIETPYRSSMAEMLTLRQAYKGWEVRCVYSTPLESAMSGERVGMIFMIFIRLFRFIFSSVSFPIVVH